MPIEPDGDVWARYMVRMREMKESHKISVQALARLRPDLLRQTRRKLCCGSRSDEESHGCLDSSLPDRRGGFDVPAGEVYHPIEASKGVGRLHEVGWWTKTKSRPLPWSEFVNLSALPVMSEGEMVADIVAIIGSLDIVLGEIDR